jgi:hypothetical protein
MYKSIRVVKKEVKLSLCLNNQALRHEDIWGVDILYFSILLHSFNTEYLFFCPSM